MDRKTLAILSALSGRNGSGEHAEIVDSLVEDGRFLTPTQQLILQYLRQSNPSAQGGEDRPAQEEAEPASREDASGGVKRRGEAGKRLRRKILELQVETQELRKRNEVFAQALGACTCWGRDTACPECAGDGAPGYFEVDRELFDELVRPALSQPLGREQVSPKPGSSRSGKREIRDRRTKK